MFEALSVYFQCVKEHAAHVTRGPRWSYIAHMSTKQYRITMKVNTQ